MEIPKDQVRKVHHILDEANYYIKNGNTSEASENIDSVLLYLDTIL